jgi:predicted CXXCH cytochrome family protein
MKAALLLFLYVFSPTLEAQVVQPTPVKIADAKCKRCHEEIFERYLSTPMARASGLAEENLIPGTFLHAGSNAEYTISNHNGNAELAFQSKMDANISGKYPLSYFLGSGHLGTTYLYKINDYLFESPVAWYAPSHSYDMKPGLEEMKQMPPAIQIQSSCLRCHMSAVQSSDQGTINRYTGVPFLHGGITCESCHGDAEQHVSSHGKAPVINPARLSPEKRDSICISCHMEGDVSVERAGHSVLNYHPGDSISDYLAFYVYSGSDLTVRGVSEVEQFAQSTCKRMSGDKMSCTTCHDPHFTPQPEQRVAFFRARCLSCHSEPQFAASHHPQNPDCTSCHMRHTGAENIPHVAWTDHRILRLPSSPPTGAERDAGTELVPIFSLNTTQRDLALAYYRAFLEGDRSAGAKAWTLLQQQRIAIAKDKEALDAMGNLSAERGDLPAAHEAFEQVLKLDPHDLTALSNLGILEARQGKLKESLALLQSAFDVNKDIAGLAMNLARVQCMSGDAAAARTTINEALVYGPGLHELEQMRDRLSECQAATHTGTGP